VKILLGVDPGIHGGLAIVAIDDGAAPQLIDAIEFRSLASARKSVSTFSLCASLGS
jgi:predicted RNase H-like nuclease (RuvC/YqgF family)